MGIFARKPWIAQPYACHPEILPLFKVGRWTHAAIPLGEKGAAAKRFLHVISFYNISGRDQGVIRTNRNRFLERVFAHASGLGQQPVLLCMDANSTIHASHCLSLAVTSGKWIDLGSYFTNNNPEPTFGTSKKWDKISWSKHVTRPDYIFVNQAALSIGQSFRIRRDLSPRGHLGLEVTIKVGKVCQTYRAFQQPKAFPKQITISEDEQNTVLNKVLERRYGDFLTAKNTDPDLAWKEFASIAEEYLRGIHVSAKSPCEGGRHGPVRFRQMNSTHAAASKKNPTEAGTRVLMQLRRTQRQSNELRRKIVRIYHTATCNQQDAHDCEVLLKKLILIAPKLGTTISTKLSETLTELDQYDSLLDVRICTIQKEKFLARLNGWKNVLRSDFTNGGGRKAYAWLKDDWKPPITAVRSRQGEIVTSPAEVVDCLQDSWNELFDQTTQPTWPPPGAICIIFKSPSM